MKYQASRSYVGRGSAFLAAVLAVCWAAAAPQEESSTVDVAPAVEEKTLLDPSRYFRTGLTLDYFWQTEGDFSSSRQDGGVSTQVIDLDSPFTRFTFGDLQIVPGGRYRYTNWDANIPTWSQQELDLHEVEFPVDFFYRKLSSPWSFWARVKPTLSTDGNDFGTDAIGLTAFGGVIYQFSSRFALAAGVYYGGGVGDSVIIPGVGFVWAPTDNLVVHLLPPNPGITWLPNDDWRISFEVLSASSAWSVEPDGQRYDLQFTSFRAGLTVDRRITESLWLTVRGGTSLFQRVEVFDDAERVDFASDVDNAIYGSVGLRLTF